MSDDEWTYIQAEWQIYATIYTNSRSEITTDWVDVEEHTEFYTRANNNKLPYNEQQQLTSAKFIQIVSAHILIQAHEQSTIIAK